MQGRKKAAATCTFLRTDGEYVTEARFMQTSIQRLQPILTPGGLRRSLLYRPLAILLAILLAPTASWFESRSSSGSSQTSGSSPSNPGSSPGLFQASAQSANCLPNCILARSGPLGDVLLRLEQEAVADFLAFHALPQSDAALIYSLGRQDLRNGVRAMIYSRLHTIIQKPAANRDTFEQRIYTWFEDLVYNNEISLYRNALQHYQSFAADACRFRMDSDVAKAYGLTYSGAAFCNARAQSNIFPPPVPAASYFYSYGLKKGYGALADINSNYSSIVADTAASASHMWSIAGIAGMAAASIAGAAITASLTALAFALSAKVAAVTAGTTITAAGINAGMSAAWIVGGAVASTTGAAVAAVAGPVFIVLIAVLAGVLGGMQLADQLKQLEQINGFQQKLNAAIANRPDLKAMSDDSTGQGFYKLMNTLVSQTDLNFQSTAALPQRRSGDDSFSIANNTTNTTSISPTVRFRDWDNNIWTMWNWGGWLVRTCTKSPGNSVECKQADSLSPSFRYLDRAGNRRTGAKVGRLWISSKPDPKPGDRRCPPEPIVMHRNSNLIECITFLTYGLPMRDEAGNDITVTQSWLEQPSFVDPGPISFSVGTRATRTITAVGSPAPTISYVSGLNDNLFSWSSTGSTYALTYNGPLQSPTGSTMLRLTATNSLGSVTRDFQVSVATVLSIVSPSVLTGVAGQPFSHTVVATGIPTPTLSMGTAGLDLPGLTFRDNGDGTGTLSGIFSSRFLDQTCVSNCGFIATNSSGRIEQPISVRFTAAPSASLVESPPVTFTAGAANSVRLTSRGATTPVSWQFSNDSRASWLRLTDNGDGTAELFGTPPLSGAGEYRPALAPSALGSGLTFLSAFPVNVTDTPVITSPNTANFTVGQSGAFGVSPNVGIVTSSSTFPNGLSLRSGSTADCIFCPFSVGGTPAVGTGGQYNVQLTATSNGASSTQDVTINVFERPVFASPNMAVAFVGQPFAFDVTTIGFPSAGTVTAPANAGPPANATDGTGPHFAVTGLPASLQASNVSEVGLRSGTLRITGVPTLADVGTRRIQITTQNGVGAPVTQTFTLQVLNYNQATTTPVNLVSTWTLSRNANNDVVATIVVSNMGSTAAQNVTLGLVRLDSTQGTAEPGGVDRIDGASTATFRVLFPGASFRTGAPGVLGLSGSYTGGTFSTAGRVLIP
jgi:hypothetical protein